MVLVKSFRCVSIAAAGFYNRQVQAVPKQLFAFSSLTFDPNTSTLYRQSERCDLQAQPAQLLGLLLDRAGEIVSREQIRQALWPDTTVAYDQSINFAIRQIRIALDLDGGCIQTIPRRGYRFVGSVTRIDSSPRRIWPRAIAIAASVVAALAAGFGAGIVMRDAPAGQFVYDHLVHPDRCPYVRILLPAHRHS